MPVDFALIGHQESWKAATDVVSALRGNRAPIPDDEVQELLPWIPPRAVCRVEISSTLGMNSTRDIQGTHGRYSASGIYIDTFIPPDRLGAAHLHDNVGRVRQAAAYAIREEAKIVSLGGFSSILIEGKFDQIPHKQETAFTTGNSLTVALIVQGILKMCALDGRGLESATLLIVGATGDVGSGCARCLAPLVSKMLLYARNVERLHALAVELETEGSQVETATDLRQFQAEAQIVICAASLASPSLLLGRVTSDAIICDAGYPKNLAPGAALPNARVFFGGLGQIRGGMHFEPDLAGVLNHHPFPNVVHGCLLEGMALALERRFDPFSKGRGHITEDKVREIEQIAARHGISLAPLYNSDGPLKASGESALALQTEEA
jgi:fatty aldehyde-generating acyl-ACP reductase